MSTLLSCDPWEHQHNYRSGVNVPNAQHQEIYTQCVQNLGIFNQSILVYLREYSVKAAPLIEDNLDYVYVDARHDYCAVMDDLQAYWPKIRSGGLLAGHDYYSSLDLRARGERKHDWSLCSNGTIHLGAVKQAVNDFAAQYNVKVTLTAWANDTNINCAGAKRHNR